MRVNRSRGVLLSFVVMLCYLCLVNVGLVFASDDVDAVCDLGKGNGAVNAICSRANDEAGTKILEYSGKDGVLTFSNRKYNELDLEEKRNFMEAALKMTKECRLGPQIKNKVYNFIEQQDSTTSAAVKYLKSDAQADFVSAKAWFRPFGSVFGVLMGIVCLLIFLFLGASIVFDIAYLVIPGFQAIVERGEEHKRPFGISREAWKTQQELESASVYRNPIGTYCKRRIGLIILCSICLGYVISGAIYDVLSLFIDAFTVDWD